MTSAALIAILAPIVLPWLASYGVSTSIGLKVLQILVPFGLSRTHLGKLKEKLNKPLTEKEKEAVKLDRARQEILHGRSGFW